MNPVPARPAPAGSDPLGPVVIGPVLVGTVLRTVRERLTGAGVPSADVDAELLVGHVLGLSRGQVQAGVVVDRVMAAEDAAEVLRLLERRAVREPLQHILGVAHFRSLELAVGPGVFVPRPETELVAQIAVDVLRAAAGETPIGVDLGTGSGAIALAMATEVPQARVFGVEDSPEAFTWTTRNFRALGGDGATCVFVPIEHALPELDGSVDVVVSNPPYIPLGAVPRDPEVRMFDPEHALYGGEDGLDVVRQVSARARGLLHPGGTLVLEHGELQAAAITALLEHDGWTAVETHRDLLGRDRSTVALR